ncbi:MAG: alpha/beta hydrolase [Chloroflexia bacterium]
MTAVLDAVGIERAHYWGYSLGALAGFGLATSAPARCATLILGGGSPYGLDSARYAAQAAAYRQVHSMADYVAQREASGQPVPPAVRAAFLASDPQALAAHFEAACTYPDLAAALPTLWTPAFLYAGDADPGFAGVRRAAAEIPGATFAALPGLDHVQAFSAGATVLPQVRAFLNRHGPVD